jgi:hypothetical protein
MKTLLHTILLASTALLSGCITVTDLTSGDTYHVGTKITKTDAQGNHAVLSQNDGWQSTKRPEAPIPRLTTWYVSKQDSGIKAWRYGYSSEENYRYIDPYAPIMQANLTSDTGWVTYLVAGNQSNDFVVKRADFRNNGQPETIGHLEGARGLWKFTPPNGETFAAYDFKLSSKGIFLLRTTHVFTYLPSPTPKAHLLPEGWSFAWTQKGDIEKSRLLVIERQNAGSIFEGGKHLIGFYDIDTGKIVDTLEMNLLAQREAANFENKFHLYNTAKGPITVALEDGYKHVTVRNLRTGEKKIAFVRDSGIATVQTRQENTGRIAVRVGMGFSNEDIYDAEDFLYNDRKAPPQ